MRPCPFCAEDVQDAAKVCKHCQRPIAPVAAAPVAAVKAKTGIGTKLALGLLALVFIGWCSAQMNTSQPTPATPTTSAPAPVVPPVTPAPAPRVESLALLSTRGYESESGNYWYVEGQVKNITDAPIRNVEVVATWFTKGGTFIKTDTAMLEFNPIMPGQVSPFKTISRGNPEMSRFNVAFKSILGRELNVRDDRKPRDAKKQVTP